MYIYIYIYTYVCIYIYIYTYTCIKAIHAEGSVVDDPVAEHGEAALHLLYDV